MLMQSKYGNHNNEAKAPLQHEVKREVMRILVVEDNDIVKQITKESLELLAYDVAVVSTGQKALDVYRKQFNLVLMDLGLPDIMGMEVTRELRRRYPGDNTPIIACTTSSIDIKQKCLNAGMNGFIEKPFSIDQLGLYLKKFLPQRADWNCHFRSI
jgi:CheY-like chemotaxis protein